MKIDFTSRKTTWIVLLLIALVPLPSILSYMQRFVVRNGIVTAYLYDVKAPIDGTVNDLAVTPGSICPNRPALLLGNQRRTGQYENLEHELNALNGILATHKKQLADYIRKMTRDIDQSLAILKARLTAEEADLKESGQRRSRTLKLVEASVAAQQEADQVEAEYSGDKSKVRSTILEIEQLEQRREMLSQGLFPQEMSDGVLQVQEQINKLELSILATKRRMTEAETASNSCAADSVNARMSRASIVIPESGVVWDVNVQNGMEVSKGDRLLSYIDRSRLMVEVAVDDATLELIEPGCGVRIRIFGRSDFIEGTVFRVMGSGAVWHDDVFAAAIRERSARDGHVLVEFKDKQLFNSIEKFCCVGRTAYAEFEGIGLVEQYFGTFLR
ncbi:HlyD family efflux transporter periplasmic adaptor subunit [Maridesulfovibrio sp.]|uniref:HlyD family secretion protein n=1 Tax=Maridesulfovibrio sp. TaxID=2795000 RepID=UPI002A18B011|nr:HlyD family efflux transporter periplasmic adaptor subunit [Maridesulfovibrio sp.]